MGASVRPCGMLMAASAALPRETYAMDYEKQFEQRPGRTAFRIGVIIILVLIGLSVVAGVISMISAPVRTVTGVVERTLNPDNVIANYEWFKRQYEDVQAIDVRLEASRRSHGEFLAAAGDRATWKFEDRNEDQRMRGIVLGLEGQRAEMVAAYNARTQMANRNIFRTGDLPDRLN